jgi:hypothetical protein
MKASAALAAPTIVSTFPVSPILHLSDQSNFSMFSSFRRHGTRNALKFLRFFLT